MQPSNMSADQIVRTTGRIKKPKAVFDPSDNYLPRAQRVSSGNQLLPAISAVSVALERKRPFVDNSVPIKKQARLSASPSVSVVTTTTTSTPPLVEPLVDVCSICQKREAKRGTSAKNKLFACLNCDKKVHKLCLCSDFEDLDRLRLNYKCDSCRKCDVCGTTCSDGDVRTAATAVTCSKCVRTYHLSCHSPRVLATQLQRNWKCSKCSVRATELAVKDNGTPAKAIREIIGDGAIMPVQSQPQVNMTVAVFSGTKSNTVAVQRNRHLKTVSRAITNGGEAAKATIKPVEASSSNSESPSSTAAGYSTTEPICIPDVKFWSVDEVTSYFAKYFPNEANVFKEQEIDGMSLLLLKRSDVIKKLPIKLGPSLRIYSHILKIQTQLNDPTLGWTA